MSDLPEDICERCGAVAKGEARLMFHQGQLPAKEFYCNRCLRILRIYAIIGFTLLGLLVLGLFSACWWLGVF